MKRMVPKFVGFVVLFFGLLSAGEDNFYSSVMLLERATTKIKNNYVKDIRSDSLAMSAMSGMFELLDGDTYFFDKAKKVRLDSIHYEKGQNKASCQSTLINGHIGNVSVDEIYDEEFDSFKKAVQNLEKEKMDCLILDLRYTNGGLLDKCIALAELFLEKNKVVCYIKGRTGNQSKEYKSHGNNAISSKVPIIVIVNKWTSSGAEMIAAALQVNKRAVIVGDTTDGIAHVSTLFPLDESNSLKLTTALIYAPNWKCLENDKCGIVPDILVKEEDDCFCRRAVLHSGIAYQFIADSNSKAKGLEGFADYVKANIDKDKMLRTLSIHSSIYNANKDAEKEDPVKLAVSNLLVDLLIADIHKNAATMESTLNSLCMKPGKLQDVMQEKEIKDQCVLTSIKNFTR